MEGSVKSLIEAESRAREIIEEAELQKDNMIKNASSVADALVNAEK